MKHTKKYITENSMVSVIANKEGELPEKILLVMAEDSFEGADGRKYINSNPEAVVKAFKEQGREMPFDIEHSTQRRGAVGLSAPAIGWIYDMVLEGTAIYGIVRWTDEGAAILRAKQYKYYSPAYLCEKQTNAIVGIVSVGLTNVPNLDVPALNNQDTGTEGETMERKIVINALNMKEDATDEEIIQSLNSMKSSLDDSKKQLEVALNSVKDAEERAKKAENSLAKIEAENLKTEINSAVTKAVEEGKILPYQKDFYITSINSREGLESFNKMIEKAPSQMPTGKQVDTKKSEEQVELNADARAVMEQLGTFSEDEKKKIMEGLK